MTAELLLVLATLCNTSTAVNQKEVRACVSDLILCVQNREDAKINSYGPEAVAHCIVKGY